MSNVTQQTAWRLKQAGMPQPEPAFGQIWHTERSRTKIVICGPRNYDGDYPHVPGHEMVIYAGDKGEWAFAPDLDYIAQFLPEGFILQMWDGRHSCKVETEKTIIRTYADRFAEAAALVYLELNKDQ